MRTALVIEDDDIAARVFGNALRRRGFQVLQALSASEAIETFRRCMADLSLVVCDAMLRSKPGPEVILELAGMRPGIRVLFTSGTPIDMWSESEKSALARLKRK